jgi:hypothetical protein
LKLSIGTPYYQGELWSTSVDKVVVLKRTHKNHKKSSHHSKGTSCEILCLTRSVRVSIQNVRTECPEYQDVYPESPGYCYQSAKTTGPESPDSYARRIRTYTRSFRVSLSQRLVSGWGGINNPIPPLILSLLLIFDQNSLKAKESSLTPQLLHSWVIFLGDWSEIVARAKIVQVSLDFISWAHHSSLARGF